MHLEIWSDVVCPWCAIGAEHLRRALDAFPHADQVDVRWRSYELDPDAPRERAGSQIDHLASKYGRSRDEAQAMLDQMTGRAADIGLEFRFDRARAGNTFDAHRLLHLAADHGIQGAVKDALFTAYLRDGVAIGVPADLAAAATAAGLPAAEVADVLDGDRYATDVRADEAQARTYGITGVPFFVLDGRLGVAGAQPPDALLGALQQAWDARATLVPATTAGATDDAGACDDGSCAT